MNLDFISPRTGEGAPVAESPMATVARAAGATLEVRDGWLVPVSFGDSDAEARAIAETVGFADSSAITKTELQLGRDAAPELAGGATPGGGLTLGAGLTLGVASMRDGAWWCPLTPTRLLVLGPRPELPDSDQLTATDVTSQFCALRLEGPLARRLMSSFCALDLRERVAPAGALRPGSIARTPGLVIVEAPARLLILVGAALAEYLWTVVADAAERLGGRPVGSDLLRGETDVVRPEAANA